MKLRGSAFFDKKCISYKDIILQIRKFRKYGFKIQSRYINVISFLKYLTLRKELASSVPLKPEVNVSIIASY